MFTAGGCIYLYMLFIIRVVGSRRSYDGKHTGCGAFRGGQSQVPDGYCAGEKTLVKPYLINLSLWGVTEVVLPRALLCLGDSR